MNTKQRLFGAGTLALFAFLALSIWDSMEYSGSFSNIPGEPTGHWGWWWFLSILAAVLFIAGLMRKPTDKLDE
jgi:hypothetical protein